MRTKRTDVQEAGDDDDPDVLGVDHVASIELDGTELGTWVSGCGTKLRN